LFTVDIAEVKGMFNTLLYTSYNFVWENGRVSSYHKYGMSFSTYSDEDIDIKNSPLVCDMSELENILQSKSITEVDIDPDKARMIVSKPYKFVPTIPIQKDDKSVAGCKRMIKACEALLKKPKRFKDKHGNRCKMSYFTVDNGTFVDAILRLGKTEQLEIIADKVLIAKNVKTLSQAELDTVRVKGKAHILLGRDGRDILVQALSGDESHIAIADERFILIENDLLTIIAGRVLEEKTRGGR